MKGTFLLIFLLAVFPIILTSNSLASAQQSSPIIGTASDNRVQITVNSYTTNATSQYYPYTPSQSGYVFAMVDVTIKNLDGGTVDTNPLYTSLKDNQNYVYTGSAGDEANDPQGLKLQNLNAGQSQRGTIYFEIPANANIASFSWDDYNSTLTIPSMSTANPSPSVPEYTIPIILVILIATAALAVISTRKLPKIQKSA